MQKMLGNTFLLIVLFVLFWNSGFIGAEYALPYTGPFTLLFWRYLALSLILFTYLLFRKKLHWPGLVSAGYSTVIGILSHAVWLGCVIIALKEGVPAGIVALVVALQPMATGAFSGLATGERTSGFQWLGLLIGFAGVFMVIIARIDPGDVTAPSTFGYLIPFGSVIGITIASLLQRRLELMHREKLLPVDISLFYQSIGTTVVVVAPAFFIENFETELTLPFITTMSWLIIVVSLSAYGIMWVLLARMDATRVAGLFYLGPPVTMLMGWLAFGDLLLFMDVMGLLVVALGVLFVQFPISRIKPFIQKAKHYV